MFNYNSFDYLHRSDSFYKWHGQAIGLLPRGFSGINMPAGAGDAGSIPGSGRSPGEGNGSPL